MQLCLWFMVERERLVHMRSKDCCQEGSVAWTNCFVEVRNVEEVIVLAVCAARKGNLKEALPDLPVGDGMR